MNFSTDRCPICSNKLEMEAIDLWNKNVAFQYYCINEECIIDTNDIRAMGYSHYTNTFDGNNEMATIIIPPYLLKINKDRNNTAIYKVSKNKQIQFIFNCNLLDFDYSHPNIANRIKLLLTFS